jgi:lysophospholipase L1-like esterase
VRVLWLGDSHAAADFWPDAVRKPLQGRFGDGGPGFVYVGLGVYRHAGLKIAREGTWHVEPRQPSLWMRQNDGVFGLGGIRAVPADAKSRVTLELALDAPVTSAKWELAFRLPDAHARFRVEVDGAEARTVDAQAFGVGAIAHVEWQTKAHATVALEGMVGSPELFGVIVENADPGLVIDTLGINGARIGTPLAWDEERWVDEARRRHPALFVLAYGTNEVGDQVAPERYGPQLESLVERTRKASPDADCLVIGPTDRAGPDWSTLPRVSPIDEALHRTADRLGCAYFSAFQAMGGEGSLKRWADEAPPLAASDHVHLTPRGYAELGTMTTQLVLGDASVGPK